MFSWLSSRVVLVLVVFIVLLHQRGSDAEPVCAHASRNFQNVLWSIMNQTVTPLPIAPAVTSLVPLRGVVVNPRLSTTDLKWYQCAAEGNNISTIVPQLSMATCASYHILNTTMKSKAALLTRLALDHLASFMLVSFMPSSSPLRIPNASYHSCPLPYDFQWWDFGIDPNTNFGVVLSSVPMPEDGGNWSKVGAWALPCAFDNNGRPVVVHVNLNPRLLNEGGRNDTAMIQDIRHQLLHALGFGMWSQSLNFSFRTPARQSLTSPVDVVLVTGWNAGLGRYQAVWRNGGIRTVVVSSCPAGTTGSLDVPFDDEIFFRNAQQYDDIFQSRGTSTNFSVQWASHLEPRVFPGDTMASGKESHFSWSISDVTRQLFNAKFQQNGVWFRADVDNFTSLIAAKSVPTTDVTAIAADPLYRSFILSLGANASVSSLESTVASLVPPPLVVSTVPLAKFNNSLVPTCSVLDTSCANLSDIIRSQRFCFPSPLSSPSPTFACSPDRLGFVNCASALQTAGSASMNIPAAFQYPYLSAGSGLLVGRSETSDYCPLADQSTLTRLCSDNATNDIPIRGNVYSASDSRCFESNISAVGPQPAAVGAVRCFRARCPFGVRVELQINGTSSWIACNATGAAGTITDVQALTSSMFYGSIRCPDAFEFCGARANASSSTPKWLSVNTAISFTSVVGSPINFLLAESTFTQIQATRVCPLYNDAANLAFIPDVTFASSVAAAVLAAYPGAGIAWVGAVAGYAPGSAVTWLSTHSIYSRSSVPVQNSSASSCFALNVTAASFGNASLVAVPCDTLLPVVCSRSVDTNVTYSACPVGYRCTPNENLQDPRLHRLYFLAAAPPVVRNASATWMTMAAAQSRCPDMHPMSQLFDLQNLTSLGPPTVTPTVLTPWYQTFYNVRSLVYTAGWIPVWTGLTWKTSDPVPPWSSLVQNWPSPVIDVVSSSSTFCFLLVEPDLSYRSLYAIADCMAKFPAMCYSQNPWLPLSVGGYNYGIYMNHVPVDSSRALGSQLCAAASAFSSPIFDLYMLNAVVAPWYSLLSGQASDSAMRWRYSGSVEAPFYIGASWNITNQSVYFSALVDQPVSDSVGGISKGAVELFAPFSASNVVLNISALPSLRSAPIMIWSSSNVSKFQVTDNPTSQLGQVMYLCSTPLVATVPVATPTCTNASLPCNTTSPADSRFSLRTARVNHSAGIQYCNSSNQIPVLAAAMGAADSVTWNSTLYAISEFVQSLIGNTVFGTGFVVSSNGSVVVSGNVTLNPLRPYSYLEQLVGAPVNLWTQYDLRQSSPGMCLGAYFAASTSNSQNRTFITNVGSRAPPPILRFKPVSCTQALPFPCKLPLVNRMTRFIPWTNSSATSVSNVMSFFAASPITTPLSVTDALRVCNSQGGDLAWVPLPVVSPSLRAAFANFLTHPDWPAGTTDVWVGFASTTSNSVRETFGISSSTTTSPACITMNIQNNAITSQTSCVSLFPSLCMRTIPLVVNTFSTLQVVSSASQPASSYATSLINTVLFPQLTAPNSVGFLVGFNLSEPVLPTDVLQGVQLRLTNFLTFAGLQSAQAQSLSVTCSSVPFSPIAVQPFVIPSRGLWSGNISAPSLPMMLFPCYAVEASVTNASDSGFSYSFQTVNVTAGNSLPIYFRMASIADAIQVNVYVGVVSDPTFGDGLPPPNSMATGFNKTLSFWRNSTSVSWNGFASNIASSVLAPPNGAGGAFLIYWAVVSCNTSSCPSTSAPAAIARVFVVANSPWVSMSLISGNLAYQPNLVATASSALVLNITVSTLPLSIYKAPAQLTFDSNCTSLRLSPTSYSVTSNSSKAVGSLMVSADQIPSNSSSFTCRIFATYALNIVTSTYFLILPVQTDVISRQPLADVLFQSSEIVSATLVPPNLDCYPGESYQLVISRKLPTGSNPSATSLNVAVGVNQSGVLQLPMLSLITISAPVPESSNSMIISCLTSSMIGPLVLQRPSDRSIPVQLTFTVSGNSWNSVFNVPPIRAVFLKDLVLKQAPSEIPSGTSSNSVFNFTVWLPQAPINSALIVINCTSQNRSATNVSVIGSTSISPTELVSDHFSGISKQIALAPPDTISDNPRPPVTLPYRCIFSVLNTNDVTTAKIAPVSLNIVIRGLATVNPTVAIVRPGGKQLLNVTIPMSSVASRTATVLPWSLSVPGSTSRMTATPIAFYQTPVAFVVSVQLTVPIDALPSTSASSFFFSLNLVLNDTTWFQNPASMRVELAPLIFASAPEVDASFSLSQPVGSASTQSFPLRLSVLPRVTPVFATCRTNPSNTSSGAALAIFSPTTAVWSPVSAAQSNRSASADATVQITGVVPGVLFTVSCTFSSSSGELMNAASTSATNSISVAMFDGLSMQFIPLLTADLSIPSFNGVLFVGDSQTLWISISAIPSLDVTISLSAGTSSSSMLSPRKDPSNCISFSPSTVTFTNDGEGVLSQRVYVTASCDSSSSQFSTSLTATVDPSLFATVAVKGSVMTAVSNFDYSHASTITFLVLPKRVVYISDVTSGQLMSSITVFCGGGQTSVTVSVNVTALPVTTSDVAVVTLNVSYASLANVLPAYAVYTNPLSLQFSRSLSPLLFRPWLVSCPTSFFTAANLSVSVITTTAYLSVQAPSEFADPLLRPITLTLKRLLTATVTIPTEFTVGTSSTSIVVSPESLPEAGKTLLLSFDASCPTAIRIQVGNTMTWTSSMSDSQQALRLVISETASNCVVAVQLASNSTARNFVPTLFQTVIDIYAASSITWDSRRNHLEDGIIPQTSSDAAQAGIQVVAAVDQNNRFIGHTTITPVPIYGVNSFDNASYFSSYLAANSSSSIFTPAFVISNEPDSGSSGVLSVLKTNPGAIKMQRFGDDSLSGELSLLNVTISLDAYHPLQDEIITILFTPYILERSDAPLSPTGYSISLYISASRSSLGAARETTFTVGYLISAGSSLLAGPTLATRVGRMASIVDTISCPSVNWRIQKQSQNVGGLLSVVRPIPLSVDSDSNTLGVFLSAGVYGTMLFVCVVVVHVASMFLMFATRLEMKIKTDSSTGFAMGKLRFPSLEVFPALYLTSVVAFTCLKVLVYSTVSGYRVTAGILVAVFCIIFPSLMVFQLTRASPVSWRNKEERSSSWFSFLFTAEGRWVTNPGVLHLANEDLRNSCLRYLAKYGMIFESFVGPDEEDSVSLSRMVSQLTSSKHRIHHFEAMNAASVEDSKRLERKMQRSISVARGELTSVDDFEETSTSLAVRLERFRGRWARFYLTFDALHVTAVCGIVAYEATSAAECQIQSWVLCGVLLLDFMVILIVRPFRHRIFNILHAIMAMTEAVAASAKGISSLVDDAARNFVELMIDVCLLVVVSLMIIKVVLELMYFLGSFVKKAAAKGIGAGAVARKILSVVAPDHDDFFMANDQGIAVVDEDIAMNEVLVEFTMRAANEKGSLRGSDRNSGTSGGDHDDVDLDHGRRWGEADL